MLQSENRAVEHVTESQKYKERVTAIFCVSDDDSHALTVRDIGKRTNQKCFQDKRLAPHRQFDRSQSKGWMESQDLKIVLIDGMFKRKEVGLASILLITDNSGDMMFIPIWKMYA